MKQVVKNIMGLALGLTTVVALAAPPKQLITHNTTDVESNAFVGGSIPSQHPTKAHSDGRVFWTMVKMACFGNLVNGRCPALIKMGTNTSNPVELGTMYLDIDTGDITPKTLSANGYTIIVNGPGETTLVIN